MCGVIAVYAANRAAAPLAQRGLLALQHRGQESAGIVTRDEDGTLHARRGLGIIDNVCDEAAANSLPGARAVGHVRYSTVAIEHAANLQPIFAETRFGKLALCHNGNLKNAAALEQTLRRDGAMLATTMDSELLAQLVARADAPTIEAAIAQAARAARGAYSLTILCGDRIFGLRDPHGLRPLVIGELPDGAGLVLASETCALEALRARCVREVAPGELVEIGPIGLLSTPLLPPAAYRPCVFELVYFARPESTVFGQDVSAARRRMGEELAERDARRPLAEPADVVVPVPDSGVAAAIGYARRSGIPLVNAVACNPQSATPRTFLLPEQTARAAAVRTKLSVIRGAVAQKRVLLVDDSLVRGTTAQQLVALLRDAGAAAVYLRIASPPIAWPCYLCIDMPSRDELLMNRAGSIEEVARHIGADDLRYLDLSGLRRAVGERFFMACMNGQYPL